MPLKQDLDVTLTPTQIADLTAAVQTIISILTAAADVQLSNEERQLPSISAQREPYAQDAVENLGPLHPNLQNPEVTLARATNCWRTSRALKALDALMAEAMDRKGDMEINADWVVVRYMNNLYDTAKRYKDANVPGANSVYDRLNDYFSRYGTEGDEDIVEPTP